jgi:hypothetical protein
MLPSNWRRKCVHGIMANQIDIASNSHALKRIADHGLFPWLLTSSLAIGFLAVVWIVLTILP